MSTGPTIKRGQSKQDYSTPQDFMSAVYRRFGPISFDLAASKQNAKAKRFFSIEQNSLAQDWSKLRKGWLWLNPPFDRIEPWARKCAFERQRGARILFLTPASIGANWFKDYVYRNALVIALNGRLCFDGKAPYPKDTILSVYDETITVEPRFSVWSWQSA